MRDQPIQSIDHDITIVAHGHRPEVTSGQAAQERQQHLNRIRDDLMLGRLTSEVLGWWRSEPRQGRRND